MRDADDLFSGHPGNFSRFFRRIILNGFFEFVESRAVFCHEFFVIQIFINQHIHNAVEESHVGADLDLGENIGHFCQFMATGIGNNELRAPQFGLFDIIGSHRMRFCHVGPDAEEHLGVFILSDRVGTGA